MLSVLVLRARQALLAFTSDQNLVFSFFFLYSFPTIVTYMYSWAPPWYADHLLVE